MRKYVVELDEDDAKEYQVLRAEAEVYDRLPENWSVDQHVSMITKVFDFELYILQKYGDEEHWRDEWNIDPVQGVLYIDD